MTKHVLLPEELGNSLLQYLATKPFAEVHKLIPAIAQCKEAPEPVAEPEPAANEEAAE